MIELRFRQDLYSGEALDAALKVYGAWARLESRLEDGVFLVRLEATAEHDETLLGDELSNYALGATIEAGRAGAP